MGERTELPTGRRLGRARSDGNVAKSSELSAAVDLWGGYLLILFLGPSLFAGFASVMRTLLDGSRFGSPDNPQWVDHMLAWTAKQGIFLAAPFLAIAFLVSFVAQFLQVGWLWTWKPVMPKLSKLNPMSGVMRLISVGSAGKLGISLVKLLVVGSVAVILVSGSFNKLAGLPALDLAPALRVVWGLLTRLFVWLLVLFLVIGVCDYVWVRWRRIEKLRMTKQEVKEEIKMMEGDLKAKAKRINFGRNMLIAQMQQNVRGADVVVTNPTHFAVALKYDPTKMGAPTVVAKGADYMAFRIREIATASGVPIVEKPPLARALYAGVDVGRAIAPEFYQAVAEILAYVYRIKQKKVA